MLFQSVALSVLSCFTEDEEIMTHPSVRLFLKFFEMSTFFVNCVVPGLYMIGYGTEKNILKWPLPFWIFSKTKLLWIKFSIIEREIQMKTHLSYCKVLHYLEFSSTLIFLVQFLKYFSLFRTLSYITPAIGSIFVVRRNNGECYGN